MGRVVAVSVAQPVWQDIYGRPTLTSIVRDASIGPVQFGAAGPEGNATAVHTEAVFAFFAEHYDLWAERLGIDRSAWADCHWGENLMLSGMPGEEDLRIGDRFRVGEALLEVTSPRIPCFKLSWRLGQPDSFLKELIASGRMGCYLRVVEPGQIGAGDAVFRTHQADDAVSVLALSQLLHDPDVVDLDLLRTILATPGLGGQASGMVRKRLSFLIDGQLPARGRWQGWRRFEITEVAAETRRVRSFRLRPLDGEPLGGYRAGQFLTLRLPEAAGGHIRTWSLSDYDQGADHYRISIQRETEGVASRWMNDHARPGTVVEVRPPLGRFVLDRSGFMRTVLISAGIGVTPLLAMLKAHAERADEAAPLLWLHSARSAEDHAFAEEVETLLAKMPNATRRIHYSSPRPGDRQGLDYDRAGRIDAVAIVEMLTETYTLSPFGRVIELTGDHSDFYLCGPKAFEDDIRSALVAQRVNPEAIRSESFSGTRHAHDRGAGPETAEVLVSGGGISEAGRSMTWRRDDDRTLLELVEDQGIAAESACRIGQCGSCAVTLRSGMIRYLVDPAAYPGEGRVLLCCARPDSARIEIRLDETTF